MRLFVILCCSLLTISCFAQSQSREKFSDSFSDIKIIEDNKFCYVSYQGKKLRLSPTPPCFLLQNSKGETEYFAYKDKGVDATLIVTGTPLSPNMLEEWELSADDKCGQTAQGILIKGHDLLVTEKTLSHGVLCQETGSDEKNYWYFAH